VIASILARVRGNLVALVIGAALSAALVGGATTFVSAQSNSSNTIQACVNRNTGAIRIVTNAFCGSPLESLVSWNHQGQLGPAGPSGGTGAPGPSGATGPAGATGLQGASGASGSTGPSGPTGPSGLQGLTGVGASGPSGPTGLQGPTGLGASGPTGPSGATGPQGVLGFYTKLGPVVLANTAEQQGNSLATCDNNDVAVGGGYSWQLFISPSQQVDIFANESFGDSGWNVHFTWNSEVTPPTQGLRASVRCADNTPPHVDP
jgi:hypothetical protein